VANERTVFGCKAFLNKTPFLHCIQNSPFMLSSGPFSDRAYTWPFRFRDWEYMYIQTTYIEAKKSSSSK